MELWKFQKVHSKLIQRQITNDHDKEIPNGRYISPEKRHKIIDDVRLI